MSRYPLSELATTPDVRQAKRFRKTAAGMTGEQLAESYTAQQQSGNGLVEPAFDAAKAPRDDGERLAAALVERCRKDQTIPLPGDRTVDLRARGVATTDKKGPTLDLVGRDGEGRLVVVALRHMAADAGRCPVGDTPLRLMIEGLAASATAEAEKAGLTQALEADERPPNEEAPVLLVVASPRYWELCRKREAQSGAAWIHELERLSREIALVIGVSVEYLTLQPSSDAEESTEGDAPETLEFAPAWEPKAGTVKVRAKSSRTTPAELIIEADPSRPSRSYAASDQYAPGDQIDHVTLGTGVVQRLIGPSKVEVLFDGTRKLLVQGRPAPTP